MTSDSSIHAFNVTSSEQALLNYVRSGFRIDTYWQTLNANGLTREKLASYDRPIVSEPHLRTDMKDGLIRDLTMYLKTLKVWQRGVFFSLILGLMNVLSVYSIQVFSVLTFFPL